MRSWIGSIALHGGGIAVIAALWPSARQPARMEAPPPGDLDVELVEPPPPPPPAGGGGGAGPPVAAKMSHQPQRLLATHDSAWAIADVHTEEVGRIDGEEGGVEGGVTCDFEGCCGGVLGAPPPPPPPPPPAAPPAPPPSRARAARLTYPTRDEDVDDEHLFVARVTVDRDGDVVGARLVRGFDLPRAREAADAIWRFHYAPALDAAGAPTTAAFEQPFQLR